jgi:hypothetical protein
MANTLDVTADNRLLRFSDDFTVEEIDANGNPVQQTTWESRSGENENEISYQFAGQTRRSIAVKYAFNSRNQLTLEAIAQPGVPVASKVWTLRGKIFADDIQDIEYVLIDDEGNLTSRKMFVYGTLDFQDGYQSMRVKFPDDSVSHIRAAGKKPLSASEYFAGGDLTRDLLAFQAVTTNEIDGMDEETPAEVKFYGRWDLHEKQLVFVTRYDSTATNSPVAYIALGGTIKGTNIGLLLQSDGKAALQLNGRYEWNNKTLGWDLKVGYSKSAGLEATLEADATIVGKKGVLTVKGGATLKKGSQGTAFEFDLKADYVAKNSTISFSLTGGAGAYELNLSGNFKIKKGNVKFEISARSSGGAVSVKGVVEFGLYENNFELKVSLQVILTRSGIELTLNMEFKFFWGPNGPVAELP